MNRKNIFITGPNSFVGKSLINELKEKYKIFALSIKKSELKILEKKHIKIKKLKKLNKDELLRLTNNVNFFGLIHCHAYGTSSGTSDKKKMLNYNLFSGLEILKFAKEKKIEKNIFFGSVSQFNSHTGEERDFYGLTKTLLEKSCRYFAAKFNININFLYLFYVYGKNENYYRLISNIVNSLKRKKRIKINYPLQKMDFLHISDLISAINKILNQKQTKGFNNFKLCYGKLIDVKQMCKILCKNLNLDYKKIKFSKKINQHSIYNIQNHKKFKRKFNWYPKINFQTGIKDY